MPRTWREPGRRRRPRLLTAALALAALAPPACAEERERPGECDGDAGCPTGIHAPGILNPDAEGFHGAEVARRGWDLSVCASCHGTDFAGGTSGASCLDCHADGPTACGTCHDQEPATAAHPAHLGDGPLQKRWDCARCHDMPARWDDEGHVRRGGAVDPPPAEVTLGDDESYLVDGGSCQTVCHGPARPRWTRVGQGEAACGTCHGTPPASHVDDRCASCHPTAPDQHLDGVVTIGRQPGCAGCHGEGDNPAPPRDLAGATTTRALGVGAHQSHVHALNRLRGPMACAECHSTPAALDSPGHIDTPAPAEVSLTGGGAWDRRAATCETWCHGASAPVWTAVGSGQVYCGSCHGIPPADPSHDPDLGIGDCVGCHPATVDAFGNILRAGPPGAETSEHMDGNVDL